jgi:pilus assembly protein CpaB
VSATSGVAGFIFPGDRVDIVLTQTVAGGGEGQPLKVSETIIRNARVLATDQRMDVKGEDGKPVVHNSSTVTLEATPKIAEKIAVAQTIGQLSLSLRSLADNNAELEQAIASGEVVVPEGTDPKAEKRMLLAIANKPIDTKTTYTIGSDVSRFQRSSVPQKTVEKPAARDPMAEAITKLASATGGAPAIAAPAAPEAPRGPTVRVARGNSVTTVSVGAK